MVASHININYALRLILILQDSFYHNVNEEELARVHDYNFDHPG